MDVGKNHCLQRTKTTKTTNATKCMRAQQLYSCMLLVCKPKTFPSTPQYGVQDAAHRHTTQRLGGVDMHNKLWLHQVSNEHE